MKGRSVKEEGEEVLQAPEQRSPCSSWRHHGGIGFLPAAHGGPQVEQIPALQPVEGWSRFLAGAVICGGPMLQLSVPEGLYPVGRAHAGAVCEGRPHERDPTLKQGKSVRWKEWQKGTVMP